jgi:hypothetical protein
MHMMIVALALQMQKKYTRGLSFLFRERITTSHELIKNVYKLFVFLSCAFVVEAF